MDLKPLPESEHPARPKFRLSRVLASLGLTKDPNPNPVGFGIMAFLTFWPSVILMIVGVARE
jgi:hypothetical protein